MSAAWVIARWEYRLLARSLNFWLSALIAAAISIHLARNGVRSPALIAQAFSNWSLTVIPLLLLPVLGSVRRRDERVGIHELVQSRPPNDLAMITGKFAAGFAALSLTWLASAVVGGIIMAATDRRALEIWPEAMGASALLALPAFAFLVTLCLALDVWTGKHAPVLAGGAAFVLASWLHHPGMWVSHLLPLVVPRHVSRVFGFDPYSGAVAANRIWALALAAGLLAFAILVLPRRTAVPRCGAWSMRLIAGFSAGMIILGAWAVAELAAVPRPGQWPAQARVWEVRQVEAALSGDASQAPRYWRSHRFVIDGVTVDVHLGRGSETAAEPLAQAVAEVLPHFPALRPHPPDAPFHVFEGSFLITARTESGALILLPRDVTEAVNQDDTLRSVVRAAAVSAWIQRTGLPPSSAPAWHPHSAEDWVYAQALYHQWVVLEQLAGTDTVEAEIELWRSWVQSPPTSRDHDVSERLFESGAAGRSLYAEGGRRALKLWDLSEKMGRQRVLSALLAAAEDVLPLPPDAVRTWVEAGKLYWNARTWTEAQERYWRIVEGILGVHLSREPVMRR